MEKELEDELEDLPATEKDADPLMGTKIQQIVHGTSFAGHAEDIEVHLLSCVCLLLPSCFSVDMVFRFVPACSTQERGCNKNETRL